MTPYEEDAPQARGFRFRGLLITGVLALVVAAGIVAVLVFMRGDEEAAESALLSDTQLRAAPSPDAAIVASLSVNTSIDLLGRSEDSAWLMIAERGRPDPQGWLPLLAIRNPGDLASLPSVSAPAMATPPASVTASRSPTTQPSPTANAPPGTSDLRIQEVTSRNNQLLLVITNVGSAAGPRQIEVFVEGEQPRGVDLGAEVAPGQTVEAVLSSLYVQRRASVTVTISAGTGTETARANTATAIVEPDQPNDLELLPPASDDGDGHLVITMRNNSPIPVLGTATISVREAPPSNRLVARYDAPFDLPPDATTEVDFTDVQALDPGELHVSLSTDAITDAEMGNNNYPR